MKDAFIALGKRLTYPNLFTDEILQKAYQYNGWFTPENIRLALSGISKMLKEENLNNWLKNYSLPTTTNTPTIALIMAGNLPLVGFHDLMSVLISGHKALIKMSSDDHILLPVLLEELYRIEPSLKARVRFTEGKLENFDAVIATGSSNSARYFDYYFSKYPTIIRKSRASAAVLSGNETKEELKLLGNDIFQFFGLGCRSVSKLFVPAGYNFHEFFEAMFPFKDVLLNKKYGNNYDYHRAIYLMNSDKLLDNNFMLLKEDTSLHSPVAVVFYEFYTNRKELEQRLRADLPSLQCLVSSDEYHGFRIPFGTAQCPMPWDYADGIDTLKFLLNLGQQK